MILMGVKYKDTDAVLYVGDGDVKVMVMLR